MHIYSIILLLIDPQYLILVNYCSIHGYFCQSKDKKDKL